MSVVAAIASAAKTDEEEEEEEAKEEEGKAFISVAVKPYVNFPVADSLTRLRLVFYLTPLRLKRNLIFCGISCNVFYSMLTFLYSHFL